MRRAPVYLERIWEERMKGLFDPQQEKTVLAWLSENWKRHRVIVVGSGFTRNAQPPEGPKVPLWPHLAKAIAGDLGVSTNDFDALQLPDLHAARHGSRKRLRKLLAKQLNDAVLKPGKSHDALWESDPAAVITTNFLDTVLEKSRPQRAQVVVTDKDLGIQPATHLRRLVYFHGHRTRPTTWVAGRQEYEALPANQPLVHAKVRQLLAEYPALIVGYSLTDPDFHLIYGDTWRAMGNARPRGLALLPTFTVHPQKLAAEQLSREYWETLGLSFVKFDPALPPDQIDDAYARFFKLTEHVATISQLIIALRKPGNPAGIPLAFERNSDVGRAALKDNELAEVFRFPDNRVRWWRDVISHSIDDASRANATEATRQTNLSQFSDHARDGRAKRSGPRTPRPPAPPLERKAWVAGPAVWRNSDSVDKLLQQLDGGNETTRQIEQLLLKGTSRGLIRDWIAMALNDPEFIPRVVERSYVAALALLADGSRIHLRNSYYLAEKHAEASVGDAVATYLGRRPPKRRGTGRGGVVRQLQQAFEQFANGDRPGALKTYATIHARLLTADAPGAQTEQTLLTYFAAQGVLDCTTWDTDLATIEELRRKRDVLAVEPHVRRWRDRIRALGREVEKSKASRQPDGYEPRGGHWSASPGELWYHYQRAKDLGAPVSVRRELLTPLLDTIPSAKYELAERLSINVKDTGKWLHDMFEAGAFAINRAAFFGEAPRLATAERHAATNAIADQLFSRESPSALARQGRLSVMRDFPDVIREQDVARAVLVLKDALEDDDQRSEAITALAKISHICSWRRVSRVFAKIAADRWLTGELCRSIQALPWEHWSECDPFWASGGTKLLRALIRVPDSMLAAQTGEVLWWLMDIAPRRDLRQLCRSWLRVWSTKLDDESVMRVAAGMLLAMPDLSTTRGAKAVRATAKRRLSVGLAAVLVRAAPDRSSPAWVSSKLDAWVDRKGWSETKKPRGFAAGSDVAEARCLVSVVLRSPERRAVCVNRLLQLMASTWSVLPTIGDILHPQYWGKSWPALLQAMRIGGHAGVSKSWLLQRVRLVGDALDADETVRSNLVRSVELAFLRSATIDALAQGDSALANNAIYVLPKLARYSVAEDEIIAIGLALVAASDDIRIGVAHGAAFTAAHLLALSRFEPIDDKLIRQAKRVATKLGSDSLAVVRRQIQFGHAQGTRYGRETRAARQQR